MWENRRTPNFDPSNPEYFRKFKLKPFLDVKISLLNFPSEENDKLVNKIIENDGVVVNFEEDCCTHLVINDSKKFNYIEVLEKSINIPKYVVNEKVFKFYV